MASNGKTTPELIEKMRKLKAEGKTYTEIGSIVGLEQSTVGYHMAKFKKKPKKVIGKFKAAKYAKRIIETAPPQKPMVCLIGTPKEIAETMREVFS
jgi:DNA-binding transcriptional ArsR family regulator